MPMLYDPDKRPCKIQADQDSIEFPVIMRKPSEESIRTEFCDGPIIEDSSGNAFPLPKNPEEQSVENEMEISDRAELIERIKRGENPTWVPSRTHGIFHEYLNPPEKQEDETLTTRKKSSSPLLPAIDLSTRPSVPNRSRPKSEMDGSCELHRPSNVERPQSALHTGDFTGDAANAADFSHPFQRREETISPSLFSGTLPSSPWYTAISPLPSPSRRDPRVVLQQGPTIENRRPTLRGRAPSLQSHSSSFVFRPPTSPLVQQSNNNDEDLSSIEHCNSPDKTNRRHTLPPHCMPSYNSLQNEYSSISSPQPTSQAPCFRREITVPFQTHRRRSSVSNWSLQASTSPQTPSFLRSRRPSVSSEASPLQHATMVGSYEESILRGRMSTGPSKPLDFTAQIGALGKGNCKPKYPAHVTIPFPAVYYSWGGGIGRNISRMDDEPSPYVGHIDLEHSLPPDQSKEKRRRQRGMAVADDLDASGDADSNNELDSVIVNHDLRSREKRKRRAPSPKAPLGGSYRIPKTGQLQIMIKNPNKTAVKLFLVPYDLEGMETGTKTFIRQRCYSAGPIIETPLTSGPNPLLGQSTKTEPKTKSTLRYLIHLNICCPSKGRYYLYQHIRVVFANRVPDNKESLKNEIQLPEPRYSIYKQNRESPMITPATGARLITDKAQRRRSYGYGSVNDPSVYDSVDGLHPPIISKEDTFTFSRELDTPPVPPLPLILVRSKRERNLKTDDPSDDRMDLDTSRPSSSAGLQSPLSDKFNRMGDIFSTSFRSNSSTSNDSYAKLSRGDVGYGGIFGRPGTPEPGEGLLARRLRGFGGEKELTDETT